MKHFISYIKNVRTELGHVVWPSRKTAINHTTLVVLLSLLTAVIIAVLDYVFTGVISRFVTGF